MGESQSKQKQNKKQVQQFNNQQKIEQEKFTPGINRDKIQSFVNREDKIEVYKENVKQNQETLNQNDVKDLIDLKLVPRYHTVQLSEKSSTVLPVMIQLETKNTDQTNRPPIDLVCVIDNSGSMAGQKAQLVRKSLKYLLKILNENDRICLISYDTNAVIETPFLRNNDQNKVELKKAIQKIQGRGSTNTSDGVEHGLWMLQNRKHRNPVSCMFLLSDGQDNLGNRVVSKIETLVKHYKMDQQFTINTYGYGNDHDSEVLLRIANMKEGNFYFIENLKKVSEWFILSLSGLLTVLAEKVQIQLQQKKNGSIKKYYGDEQVWDSDYIIHIPHLVQSNKKEYIFEIEFPKQGSKKILKDEQKKQNVLSCLLKGAEIEGQKANFSIESFLEIQFFNHNEKFDAQNQLVNERFEANYLRAKGGDIIGRACEISKKGQYKEATQLLDDFLKEIEACPFQANNAVVFIKNDIIKCKEACQPQVFEKKKGFFLKKKKDHVQRQASMCNLEDWDDNQKNMMQDYEDGKYQLSDDSCVDDNDDSDEENKKQISQIQCKPQVQQNQGGIRNRKFSDYYSSDGDDDDDDDVDVDVDSPKIQKLPSQHSSTVKGSSRRGSFIEEEYLNDVQKQALGKIDLQRQGSFVEFNQLDKEQRIVLSPIIVQKPRRSSLNK